MSSNLPPDLARLFMPRPPLKFLSPTEKDLLEPPPVKVSGLSDYVKLFSEIKDDVSTGESLQKILSKKEEKLKLYNEKLEIEKAKWDPSKDEKITSNPYKTLFVCRMAHSITEKQLRRLFETYGPIRSVKVIHDLNDKPKGYAFVEFEREKDMKAAYRETDGKKLDNRRILVDVERSRTVKGWLPKRLGGGLGNTRSVRAVNYKHKTHNEESTGNNNSSTKGGYRSGSGGHKDWRGSSNGEDSKGHAGGQSRSEYHGGSIHRSNKYMDRSPNSDYSSRSGSNSRSSPTHGRPYTNRSPIRSDRSSHSHHSTYRKNSPPRSIGSSKGYDKYPRTTSYGSSGRFDR